MPQYASRVIYYQVVCVVGGVNLGGRMSEFSLVIYQGEDVGNK